MARSVIDAGMHSANQVEDSRIGTPVNGTTRRFQGQVQNRPKPARVRPRELPSQKAWEEYQALRSAAFTELVGGEGDTAPTDAVNMGYERGTLDREGRPRVGAPDQGGFAVPATPNGRVPWLTKDYVRATASPFQWGWPAFNTNALIKHTTAFLAGRFRGQYPGRGLKSVTGIMDQPGSGEASRMHIPAVFIPSP
jgi:hypothetical protein